MNSDFVLVRGSDPLWFYCGLVGWSNSLDGAHVFPDRKAAERAIERRQKQGKWGNVGYMTVGEAREALAAKRKAARA